MTRSDTHHPHTTRRQRRSAAGYSFIEILIVMGIIAVLVGMVLVVIQIADKRRAETLTRARVLKVAAGMSEVRRNFGVYAPRDIHALRALDVTRRLRGRLSVNDTNESIETATQAMFLPGQAYDPQIHEDEFCNTDGDRLPRALHKRGDDRLLEIRDEWDNPLIYIPSRAYGPVDTTPIAYITGDGERVLVRPWKTAGGHFEQPTTFQVFSMGPDGRPNTEDDIKHWRT